MIDIAKRILSCFVFLLFLFSCFSSPRGGDSQDATIAATDNDADYTVLEGFILLVKDKEGTLSENSYYVLSDSGSVNRGGILLFQETSGRSRGFDQYIGLKVKLEGYYGRGQSGWKGLEGRGFVVRTISLYE